MPLDHVSSNGANPRSHQYSQQVLNRNSTDREMTPDSIDSDPPAPPANRSKVLSKKAVTNGSEKSSNKQFSRNPVANNSQGNSSQSRKGQNGGGRRVVKKVVMVDKDEANEDEYEDDEIEQCTAVNVRTDARAAKTMAHVTAERVVVRTAADSQAAANRHELHEEDELNTGVYIEEAEDDEDEEYDPRYHYGPPDDDDAEDDDFDDDDEFYDDEDQDQEPIDKDDQEGTFSLHIMLFILSRLSK